MKTFEVFFKKGGACTMQRENTVSDDDFVAECLQKYGNKISSISAIEYCSGERISLPIFKNHNKTTA